MLLIILGFIVFLLSFGLSREVRYNRLGTPLRGLGVLLIIIGVFTSCIVQIDAGYIGVRKLFGRVQNQVLSSGLHFINPLMEVVKMDIRTQNYTMSGANDEGVNSGDDA